MKKLLLAFLAIFSLTACNRDDESRIETVPLEFDAVSIVNSEVEFGEPIKAKVKFSFKPDCEVLIPSYYFKLDEENDKMVGEIAKLAQYELDKNCKSTEKKEIHDIIDLGLRKPGKYTLKFLKKLGYGANQYFTFEVNVKGI